MTSKIEQHYSVGGGLAGVIASGLRAAGKDLSSLTPADLEPVDEFHIRGRRATLELAARMELRRDCSVLDVGSGLGGPARTIAHHFQCRVTGVDLTADFCAAANAMSEWVGLAGRTVFQQGDATTLDFEPSSFDSAFSIHAAMNIAAKDALYSGVHRILKPGGIFAIYDILQGEGGDVHFPVPWARDPAISHIVTPRRMRELLTSAGFSIIDETDSTEESSSWFRKKAEGMQRQRASAIGFKLFLGEDYSAMAANQVRNLAERRIRTVSYIARR